MQAWDITIADNNTELACGLMFKLLAELAHFDPIAGYHYSFSYFEMYPAPLIEFSHSDAILGLRKQNLITWVYFVSSQMAIVVFSKGTESGEALDQALQACISWNKEQTKKYKETGEQGSFIERIVLSKTMMAEPSIQARMQDTKERVFWDKYSQFAEKGGKDTLDSRSIEALHDKEVVVTLHNFPYLTNKQATCEALVRRVQPLTFTELQRHAGALHGEDLKLDWSATHLAHIFKITCSSANVANYLCTKVIDMNFLLADTLASLNMKSSFHIVGQQDFKQYFGNYMITDVVPQMNTAQEDAMRRQDDVLRSRKEWSDKERMAKEAEQKHMDAEQLARDQLRAHEAMMAAQTESLKKQKEEEEAHKAELLKLKMENEELKAKLQQQEDLDEATSYSLPSEHLGFSAGYDATT